MELIIKTMLTISGFSLGYKNKQLLGYLFIILIPFYDVGVILNMISMSDIIKYFIAFPMATIFILQLLDTKETKSRLFIFIFVMLIILTIYLGIPVLLSHSDRLMILLPMVFLGFVVFLYFIKNIKKIQRNTLLKCIKYTLAAQIIISILQFFGVGNDLLRIVFSLHSHQQIEIVGFYRSTGTFMDPNYFALYMTVWSYFFITISQKHLTDKIIFALSIITILLTGSRMGLLLVAFMIFIISLKSKTTIKILIGISLLTLVIAFTNLGNILLSIFIERFQEDSSLVDTPRIQIAQIFFTKILTFKNVWFGVGYDSMGFYTEQYLSKNWIAHNQLIQLIADVGLIGLTIITFLIIGINKFIPKSQHNRMKGLLAIIIFGSVFLTITYELHIYVMLSLYLIVVLQKGEKNEKNSYDSD